jgi:hypothetical protein
MYHWPVHGHMSIGTMFFRGTTRGLSAYKAITTPWLTARMLTVLFCCTLAFYKSVSCSRGRPLLPTLRGERHIRTTLVVNTTRAPPAYTGPVQSSRGDTHGLSLFCDERHESSYFKLRFYGKCAALVWAFLSSPEC